MPGEHGVHVAGTVLGSGLVDPDGAGMASRVEAYTYNFNTQRNGLSGPEEMQLARKHFGISITQNSYGLQLSRSCAFIKQIGYLWSDRALDLLSNWYPTLTHIFAAGNDQAGCIAETYSIWGAPGYGTTTQRSKNTVVVGAVTDEGKMASFSSWGPTDDGRLSPTVCAKGVDVWSTKPSNEYQSLEGTSMACPTVSGHASLLQERYAQLFAGRYMRSDLLRALLANTATDAGRPGPDFQFGYGIMNAEKAVRALEQGYYRFDSVELKKNNEFKIAVPAGCKGLRVMIAWNDPAYGAQSQWGSKVLVNDLDLILQGAGKSYQPWVCNPTKGHVADNASRGVDTLNNIEQVTLSADELVGVGEVAVTVRGTIIANGVQGYTLTWWFDEDVLRLVAPANGQLATPESDVLLVVENAHPPYQVELSYDGGKTYTSMGTVTRALEEVNLKIPADAPLTQQAVVRVVDADRRLACSPHPFIIAAQPQGLKLTQSDCGVEGWHLQWKKVDAAVKGYAVLMADAATEEWKEIGRTANADGTEFDIPRAPRGADSRGILLRGRPQRPLGKWARCLHGEQCGRGYADGHIGERG